MRQYICYFFSDVAIYLPTASAAISAIGKCDRQVRSATFAS
ncbi:hypothetical protein [Microcoleus sp.]